MSEKHSEKSEKPMSISTDFVRERTLRNVRRLAEPVMPGESIKALIGKVSRKTGIPFPRVKGFWYGENHMVRAEEYLTIEQKISELEDRRKALEPRKLENDAYREAFRKDHAITGRILGAATRELVPDPAGRMAGAAPSLPPLARRKADDEGKD